MPVSPFTAAHRSHVKSLYKRMLANELNWVIRRDIWREKAIEIRAEFERNRCVRLLPSWLGSRLRGHPRYFVVCQVYHPAG